MDPKKKTAEPFADDSQYFDAEFRWLQSYVHLIDLERRRASDDDFDGHTTRLGTVDKTSNMEQARQISSAREATDVIRKKLDGQLENHRRNGTFTLGLDILCDQFSLTPEERLFLLVLTVPTISGTLADAVLAPVSAYNGSIQVQELVGLLQPACVTDWMQHRKMFAVSSPLVKNGLISLDFRSPDAKPGDLWNADVTLTSKAFAVVTGDPSMMNADIDTEEVH